MEKGPNSTNSFQIRLFIKGKAIRQAETIEESYDRRAKRNQLD